MEAWQSKLAQGDTQTAWDLFIERYGRLILATIRRVVGDHDDVMDVYATVCQELSLEGCARLRRYSGDSASRATVATWLVVVVRNLAIDWRRQKLGRRRVAIPANLTGIQEAIYRAVCLEGRSYVEAFEQLSAEKTISLTYSAFLRELRAMHGSIPRFQTLPLPRSPAVELSEDIAAPETDQIANADSARQIGKALAAHPADVRLAIQLFIVDGLPADHVARAVGWANGKAVYNRVYRALASLRDALGRTGIGRDDL